MVKASMTSDKKWVHVAVGVIENAQGDIFIALRAPDAHQGGLWEFPGGKLEAGETTAQALARELREELAIEVQHCEPLIQIRHHYSDKSVLLDVWRVSQFRGEPRGNEGQPVRWVSPAQLSDYEFPAANLPIINAIRLAACCAISAAYQSPDDFVAKAHAAANAGAGMLIVRDGELSATTHGVLLARLGQASLPLQLQLNTTLAHFTELQALCPAAGLHLNRHQLGLYQQRPLGASVLLGASCHSEAELQMAANMGVDYALLSPVLPTQSHPEVQGLGWESFTHMVRQVNFPVYALGGVAPEHLPVARAAGAQGVAALRAFWP